MKVASIPAALFLGGPVALLGAGALCLVLPPWAALVLGAVAGVAIGVCAINAITAPVDYRRNPGPSGPDHNGSNT